METKWPGGDSILKILKVCRYIGLKAVEITILFFAGVLGLEIAIEICVYYHLVGDPGFVSFCYCVSFLFLFVASSITRHFKKEVKKDYLLLLLSKLKRSVSKQFMRGT